MRGQASDLGSNWFLTRNLNFTRDYLAAVQKITPEDIRRVAGKYLTSDNLTIVSLNPKGALAARTETSKPIVAGEIQKIELSNGMRSPRSRRSAPAADLDGARFSRRLSGRDAETMASRA